LNRRGKTLQPRRGYRDVRSGARRGAPQALYVELTQCVRRRNKLFQLYVVEIASGYAGNGVININLATDFPQAQDAEAQVRYSVSQSLERHPNAFERVSLTSNHC